MKVAVTGAYSYSGKYVTGHLLARGVEVIALTGHPNRPDPFQGRVRSFPLDFSDPVGLTKSLAGVDVLVNTYWIRFDRGENTQDRAVQNTSRLIDAAASSGVGRIVHISITNPSVDSQLAYFRGKALNEQAVRGAPMSHAILRPTVLFGTEDILINNIAYLLRRLPAFFVAGHGDYRLQPVFVDDLAALVEDAVFEKSSYVVDAVGPEVYTFRALVDLIGGSIGARRRIVSVHPWIIRIAARILGVFVRDTLLTDQELAGLMANLLVSSDAPRCPTRLSTWLSENAERLGIRYASELKRHYLGAS